jgi:branched-chain amino acid transport system ATP-binding protein
MSFLSVRSLRAGYGQAVIVRDVDLEVDPGESVAVIGRNGSGKSTLLNTFFGRTTLVSGTIEVDGRPLHGRPGYLAPCLGLTISPQCRHILPHLSVEENLRLGSAAQRRGNWSLERVYELFPVLHERRAQSGTAMSGGQQQMLAIGRALMGNPQVLLLDEPTEGLSPKLIDDLAAVIGAIVKSGTGVVLVEQHLNLVRRVSQRFVVMCKGEIVDRGRVVDIDDEKHRASISFN